MYTLTGTVLFTDKADKTGDVIKGGGITLPESVPVTLRFDRRHTVGVARLKKAFGTVKADVEIEDEESLPKELAKSLPPAIGAYTISRDGNMIESCRITELSFVNENSDPDVKPLKEPQE